MAPRAYTQKMVEDRRGLGGCVGGSLKLVLIVVAILLVISLLS